MRTTLAYAKEIGVLSGNKNKSYFVDEKEKSFSMIDVHKDFAENRDLYKIMYSNVIPVLEKRLSGIDPGEMDVIEEEYNY